MHGGAVGSKNYLIATKIHDATVIWALTSHVAANQLAAGAFSPGTMATQDLTSPVAANQLAAGAFFPVKMTTPGNAGAAARGGDPPPAEKLVLLLGGGLTPPGPIPGAAAVTVVSSL